MQVVLVDDNRSSCQLLEMMLGNKGFQVQSAYDGESGLALIRSVHPRFAIIDIGLPVITGVELVRQLKADPNYSDVTCVALTGNSGDHAREESLEAGFAEHFVKPIRPSTLAKFLSESCEADAP